MKQLPRVLRELRLALDYIPRPARGIIAAGAVTEFMLAGALVIVVFGARDDPILLKAARYIRLVLMCSIAAVPIFVAAASLFLILRRRDDP